MPDEEVEAEVKMKNISRNRGGVDKTPSYSILHILRKLLDLWSTFVVLIISYFINTV